MPIGAGLSRYDANILISHYLAHYIHHIALQPLVIDVKMALKPTIILLTLMREGKWYMEERPKHLIDAFSRVQQPVIACGSPDRLLHLLSKSPRAVLVQDAGIALIPEYLPVANALAKYTREGGTVIVGWDFNNRILDDPMLELSELWGLSWRLGSYFRTTYHLQTSFTGGIDTNSLASTYSAKAQKLLGVDPAHALYTPGPGSVVESKVFPPDFCPVRTDDVAFALAPVGQGFFGFAGDVNDENDTTKAVLAVLGIPHEFIPSKLSQPGQIAVSFRGGSEAPHQVSNGDENPALAIYPDAVRPAEGENYSGTKAPGRPPVWAPTREVKERGMPEADRNACQPIILLTLDKKGLYYMQEHPQHLIDAFTRAQQPTIVCGDSARLLSLISRSPRAVLVQDGEIARDFPLAQTLAHYTREGGTVILGWDLNNHILHEEFAALISFWGLPWRLGSYFRTTYVRQDTFTGAFKRDGLAPAYSAKAHKLQGVAPAHALYAPGPKSVVESKVFPPDFCPVPRDECPVAWAPVGKGFFGFTGDINFENDTTKAVLAMLGIPHAFIPSVHSGPGNVRLNVTFPGNEHPNSKDQASGGTDDPPMAVASDVVRRADGKSFSGARLPGMSPIWSPMDMNADPLSGSMPEPDPDACAVCAKPAQSRCSSCKLVKYCSAAHQQQDWKDHKPLCKKLQRVGADGVSNKHNPWATQ
ncbi:uncharacterized protein BXZ73DRAFT_98649 [Epithele typhae]|uniref:uncharacterized protein n=1 Tax=Epithele typhae TaxID=378194 RepID=UPI0020082BBB|nr:uncharacterized protein BXZ73DRAFT_98649 [Epithele typhae]KAH9940820.1 hypothetical protein BXZ73DRAFT_98649 [Epithele typhae]